MDELRDLQAECQEEVCNIFTPSHIVSNDDSVTEAFDSEADAKDFINNDDELVYYQIVFYKSVLHELCLAKYAVAFFSISRSSSAAWSALFLNSCHNLRVILLSPYKLALIGFVLPVG